MVLILSEKKDVSTIRVIDWLLFYNQPFVLITNESKFSSINIKLESNDFDFALEEDNGK